MVNKLEVRDKKAIYMNHHRLLKDVFDDVREFNGYLIAYNLHHLVIISPTGDLLVSEEGTVCQVSKKHISLIRNDIMGVYCYDGSLAVPFEYYAVCILDGRNDKFKVQKDKDGEFIAYKEY